MSNDGDRQSPGPQPNPFDGVRSDGSPGQPRGTNDVEPGGTTGQAEPVPEYFSDASLPPVIEAFPGYQGVQLPPRKVAKVIGSRVIGWPAGVGIGVAGIAVILVVAVFTVLLTHRRGPNPGPPAASPPPTLTTPEQLNGILLSSADINAVMGATGMQASAMREQLDDLGGSVMLSQPDCVGALWVVQGVVYAGSGETAVRAQEMSAVHNALQEVDQAAVMFPSADEASRFVQNSADKWKSCENQTVADTSGGWTSKYTFASLIGRPPAITLNHTSGPDYQDFGCQHALSAVSNVVIDVNACNYHITNEGSQIADKMVAKVKGQ